MQTLAAADQKSDVVSCIAVWWEFHGRSVTQHSSVQSVDSLIA